MFVSVFAPFLHMFRALKWLALWGCVLLYLLTHGGDKCITLHTVDAH